MVSSSETSPEKEKRTGNGQTMMDLIKGIHYSEENGEIYLVVVVDVETRRFCRKSSPEVHRKPSFSELQRPICEATSGGSKKGSYFSNQHVKTNTSIYIGLGLKEFGNSRYFRNH